MIDLISPEYLKVQQQLHADPGYGVSGHLHCDEIAGWATAMHCETLLDFGCGQGTLRQGLIANNSDLIIYEYDPAVADKCDPPANVDIVACTDVLEHVEPDKLAAVLAYTHELANRAGFFVICCRPANRKLPDGRNAHIMLHDAIWWMDAVRGAGWSIVEFEDHKGQLKLWLCK